jgi:hypothetical protein
VVVRRRIAAVVVLAVAVVAVTVGAQALTGPGSRPAGATRTTTSTTVTTTTTTVAPTTTSTVDPGTLPQTDAMASSDDALFEAHVQDLWRAVVDGNAAEALPAFFPLSAYIQVKGISDPEHDYDTRLIPDFEADVRALHAQLGAGAASATFTGIDVQGTQAQWILPGVEYNKGSYWRVYGTVVHYTEGTTVGSFPVTSMISWRGEWYVVHLGAIR